MAENNHLLSESLGLILRRKDNLSHSKGKFNLTLGINKILFYDQQNFFTAGRDGVIKLWQNNKEVNIIITYVVFRT